MIQFTATPVLKLQGIARPPSDKSISHRSLFLAAINSGDKTRIKNLLPAEDVLATARALQACGVSIEKHITDRQTDFIIHQPHGHLTPPATPIDCGNSGTLIRLFAGLATGLNLPCRLVGDSSLSVRPMQRIVAPLVQMGGNLSANKDGCPPIEIKKRNGDLGGMLYKIPVASAQVKSAILLAGLYANNSTITVEPQQSRNHTEIMLKECGAKIRTNQDGSMVELQPSGVIRTPDIICVPADMSSAMFFIVAATIAQTGSQVTLSQVGINPTRMGGIHLLKRMGANIHLDNISSFNGEPIGDLHIQPQPLSGIDITESDIPSAIDDLPVIMIAAATANGTTTISGAGELRKKESDRISAMAAGLVSMGITCQTTPDGIIIEGKGSTSSIFSGGKVDSFGDHRIAMSFAIASTISKKDIIIDNCDNVKTSFPNFPQFANALGFQISEKQA